MKPPVPHDPWMGNPFESLDHPAPERPTADTPPVDPPVLEDPPSPKAVWDAEARQALRDRDILFTDELDDLEAEGMARGNGREFCRTDNRKLHYFSGLVREHGLMVSAFVCHLVMAMRHKIRKHGMRCAVEWDPVIQFAQHLGLSDRQARRVVQAAVDAGFIESKRYSRGLVFRLLDKRLLARADRHAIDKSLLSFLSLTEAVIYATVFLHTRGVEIDEAYPAGKGFATTYRRMARVTPWTDHHGVRTAFNRLLRRGLLERSTDDCNAWSVRFRVKARFLQYRAAELAALFCPKKWGERDDRSVNEMADQGERNGRSGERDGRTITQGQTGHRVEAGETQSYARVSGPVPAPAAPPGGVASSPDGPKAATASSGETRGLENRKIETGTVLPVWSETVAEEIRSFLQAEIRSILQDEVRRMVLSLLADIAQQRGAT